MKAGGTGIIEEKRGPGVGFLLSTPYKQYNTMKKKKTMTTAAEAAGLEQVREKYGSRVQGGDGQTRETAIVLTTRSLDTIRLEYDIFSRVFGTNPEGQRVVSAGERHYDVLSRGNKELWLDITAYWEHTFGK